jgi:hypothetical protein
MTTNRKIWLEQIRNDYPNVPVYIVNWLLDIYQENPDFYKEHKKKASRGRPRKNKLLEELNKVGQKPDVFEIESIEVKCAEPRKPNKAVIGEDGLIKVSFD